MQRLIVSLAASACFITLLGAARTVAEEETAVVLYGGGNTPDAAIAVTAAGSDPVLIKGLMVNTIAHRAVLVNAWAKVFIEDCAISLWWWRQSRWPRYRLPTH